MGKYRRIVAALMLSVLLVFASTPLVSAANQASSTNYSVSEVQFGIGGALNACSTTYCAKQSAGELAVGNTKSTNYQAYGGLNSEREPFLAVNVSAATLSLGTLTSSTVASASTTFSVSSYLSSGYVVTISGTTPTNNSTHHALTPMATAGPAIAGTEQFGINLRLNTSPAIGADPVQVPSSAFSFGTPATAYNTVNYFKYVAGDTIAKSNSTSGETDYTMSMIADVATTTGGGSYNGRLVINVVPTF
jgi:hypothetical protein